MRFTVGCCIVSLSLTGCASIVGGQLQSLSIDTREETGTQVVGAVCQLANDKGKWFVTTPGSSSVQRSYEDLAVRCEKPSLPPGLVVAKSGTKPLAFGNIIFGGVVGAGVDIATGAAYDYPPMIIVTMGKSGTASAPAPGASSAVKSVCFVDKQPYCEQK